MSSASEPLASSALSSRARRTNVERSAATREKVINAAVTCLNELGYQGTTVILVAKKAGVSRGAAQHQFPSKVDLMVGVAEQIIDHQTELRSTMWKNLVADGDTLSKMVDFSWELQSHPENVALLEIMMATRNDEDLLQRFQPFFAHMNEMRKKGAAAIAKLIGAPEDHPRLVALIRLHYAVMRGLAIDSVVSSDDAEEKQREIRAAVELLKLYEDRVVRKLYYELQEEQPASEGQAE